MDVNSPKVKRIGTGLLLSNFHAKDVLISKEALDILLNSILSNKSKTNIGLEIISKTSIWWASTNSGIILPLSEGEINVYDIPYHTIISNDIDEKLLEHFTTKR